MARNQVFLKNLVSIKTMASMKEKLSLALYRWLPPILWMGLIFFVSSQPTLPSHPDELIDLIIKKAGHIAEYGFLALLFRRAFLNKRQFLPLLLTVLYAASDEYHQTFVPGRNGDLLDLGADVLGALLALGALR